MVSTRSSILTIRDGDLLDAKLLKQQTNLFRVSTGDPLCPRRFRALPGSSLFSTACFSRGCGYPVESCGTLLKAEAAHSYKIIHTASNSGCPSVSAVPLRSSRAVG